MSKSKYLTAPLPTKELPRGIPYIISNEAAERFSFYGMRTILMVFMTRYLLGANGKLSVMSEEEATSWYHWFVSAVYFTPLLGSLLSDIFLGKYRTILFLSLFYCFGHLALALDQTRVGLAIGLVLITFGAGGIKPCVTSHVGDQFGRTNQHLMERIFSWFYFSINVGAFFSSLLTPLLLDKHGPQLAFGVPGILMLLATIAFWMGRHKFIHIPPAGWASVRETLSGEGIRIILRLCVIFLFLSVFYSLYDQSGSSWVLQAEKMNLKWMGFTWLASQVQSVNALMILVLVPFFAYVVYPLVNRVVRLTALRKMTAGLFLTAASFAIITWIETRIAAGEQPSVGWQVVAYLVLTAAEVLVSVTCLEFSYTQAPRKMKSFIMAVYFLSISAGNAFTALVNKFIQNADGSSKLAGPSYFVFFMLLMLGTSVVFIGVAWLYPVRNDVQEERAPENLAV